MKVMGIPKAIVVLLVILWIVVTSFSPWGWLMLMLALIFFSAGWRKVPYKPPHIGLLVVWGKRIAVVLTEGWHFLAPFFPFLIGMTLIKVEKVNIDFSFSDIRTKAREEKGEEIDSEKPKAGGELSVNISLTYIPDYKSKDKGKRLIAFLNSGGEKGVENIIRDLIAEDVREMGHSYDWEKYTFSTGELGKRLLKKLTGEELKKGDTEKEKDFHENGFRDVKDLGIRISRFTMGKVKEQGRLAKAAETSAVELQQKRGEEIELKFVQKMISKLKRLGMSPREAADTIQVERGKASKQITSLHGVENIGGVFIAGMGMQGAGGKEKTPSGERSERGKTSEKMTDEEALREYDKIKKET